MNVAAAVAVRNQFPMLFTTPEHNTNATRRDAALRRATTPSPPVDDDSDVDDIMQTEIAAVITIKQKCALKLFIMYAPAALATVDSTEASNWPAFLCVKIKFSPILQLPFAFARN